MLRRVRTATITLGALGVCLVACASPTLPLPPPEEPVISPSPQAGYVHLHSSGGAEPNAIIVIVNEDTNVPLEERVTGSEADGTGSWDAEVFASTGDVLDVSEEYGDAKSAPTQVTVP
jgi:hypothetical protein